MSGNPGSDEFWRSEAPWPLVDPRLEEAPPPPLPETSGCVLLRTSGSEGRPKWIALPRSALLASANAVNAHLGVTAADRWLRVLPVFHAGGLGIHARAFIGGNAVVVDEEKWNATRFAGLCRDERITLTSLVPAQVHDLVAAGLGAPPALRAIVVGGGELRPALWSQARTLGWPVLTSYGLTEAASQVATMLPTDADPGRLRLLPHWRTRVDDTGRLSLHGPALFSGTVESGGGTCWRFIPRGGEWFLTSDRVRLADGFLTFLGRCDRRVKILGELVDLHQLDGRLEDIAREEGASGRVRLNTEPDERRGHRLVLLCEPDCAAETIRRRFDEAVSPRERLSAIRIVPALARSALGKPLPQAP